MPTAIRSRRLWRWVVATLLVVVVAAAWTMGVLGHYRAQLLALPATIEMLDADQGVGYVRLADVSPTLVNALVATEDQSFWYNPGIDPEGIIRAAWTDIRTGSLAQGGSTISQELVRDRLLNLDKTVTRKLKEVVLALALNRYYDKRAILTMYLNQVYLGHGAYGVVAAARVYFGTTPALLTPAQATLLAGLPQAPSYYDPLTNLAAARQRQREVLSAMVNQHYITATQASAIFAQPLGLLPPT